MSFSKIKTHLLIILVGSALAQAVQAAPDSFVYEGVLEDGSGPITTSSTLTLRIYDPNLGCLLYEEQQSVTPGSDGSFSLRVGSAVGNAKRTSDDPGLSMAGIFTSSGSIRGAGTNCTTGYSATSSEGRRLVINVNGSDLSPAIDISSAPFAVSAGTADKIANYDVTKILRTDGAASIAALDDAKVTVLQNILNGSLGSNPTGTGEVVSKAYVDSVASNLLPANTSFSGDVSGTSGNLSVGAIKGKTVDDTGITAGKVLKYDGTKWVMGDDDIGNSLTLGNGNILVGNASGPAEVSLSGDATLSNAGALTLVTTITAGSNKGAANKVAQITYDAKGRLTGVTEVTIDDNTKLPLAGGTLTGDLSTQNISMAADKYFGLSANSTPGNVPGQMWYDAGVGVIKYYNGSTVKSLGVAGAGITSLNGLSTTTQTFATGTSGNYPMFSSTTNTHTLNIPMASSAGTVTAGLISNAEYATLSAKQSNALADGSVWIGNSSGSAEARALSGDATISNAGVVTVDKTQSGAASKILQLTASSVAVTKGADIGGAGSGIVSLRYPNTATNTTLTFPGAAGSIGQLLQTDGSGVLSWANLNISDLKSSVGGPAYAQQFPTTCTASQTMVWNSPADVYDCVDIIINNMATVTTAPMNFHVNSSGDDSLCNGSLNMSYSPGDAPNCAFKTLQRAIDKVPDVVRHNVTISVHSSLILSGSNQRMAIINKAVAAQDLTNGPFIKIEGVGGNLLGAAYTEGSGIVVGPLSRGVYLKNLQINDFTKEALSVEGGMVLIEGVSFYNNNTAIKATSSAHVGLVGSSPINISLSNPAGATNGSRGIDIYQASMHSEMTNWITIDVGTSSNNRGISLSQGTLSLEGGTTQINTWASNYVTGIEIFTGGDLYVESGHNLQVNMGNNPNSQAVNVRGGNLLVSGTLELQNIYGQGLSCDSGASCQIYGSFTANSGNGKPYVAVRGNSNFQVQGNFTIGGPEGTGFAGLEISDNSTFKFNPYSSGKTFSMTGGSSVAIRLKNGGIFSIETYGSPTFYVTNYMSLYEAYGNSLFAVDANFADPQVNSMVPGEAYSDEMSHLKILTTNLIFPVPKRLCRVNMTSVGKGPSAFCIDSSSQSNYTYSAATSYCNNKGLKLCSKVQYAQYCADGNSISSAAWTEGTEHLICSPSSVTTASSTSFGDTKQVKCCL